MPTISEAQKQATLDAVRENYKRICNTEKFKSGTTMQQKYMLALECGVTIPCLDKYLKETEIKI